MRGGREGERERERETGREKGMKSESKVCVVYYLCRNGQLEHPHFMEVSLSSPDGLYLRDVLSRLTLLRGKDIAYMYSWSSKRSYKNGYVWHDLSEDDMLEPTNGNDYILKGSELHQSSSTSQSNALSSISVTAKRKKNQSWSSFENPHEQEKNNYRVIYKSESNRELGRKFDAATQTEDTTGRRRRSTNMKQVEEKTSVETISSNGLKYENGHIGYRSSDNGKMKASHVFKKLITCGSSFTISRHI
ncbi:unnamed protein product [Fraxinus pennsylvanica]|uniref:SOSEKI DIX-like domain-containing protein n=1 Tax=Fraxinus pennsylvanica TaxID=56036 RepID=A0AAD1Z538_9LAMI|nr:unnamed protein product [Fraxinus pennsylvanica]